MIIVMNSGATKEQIDHIIERVQELGLRVHPIYGEFRTVIACVGDEREKMGLHQLESVDGVERVVPILKPFKLASKEWSHATKTSVKIRVGKGGPDIIVGPDTFVVMAGSLFGRKQRTDSSECRDRQKSRCICASRRSL